MSPEQRRAMIVQAALPLIAQHGAAITTQQIARAAGIGEATIFRAFADKDAVLEACMAEAANPAGLLRELASIPLDQPLADRLTEALDAMRAHLDRMGAVAGALMTSGHRAGGDDRRRESGDDRRREGGTGRAESLGMVREAVAELLQPDQDTLRLPLDLVAEGFLAISMAAGRAGATLSHPDLVDLFLHGALTGGSDH
ncbi:TetR/AcrR family transcriptional regulator [Nonomuraea rhodomycinica]|uniref:TetR/AcrR family transcriptional regulator n=2 Tax=Nonomuraea rhodomycinica TaxID=1712872 RepID=A0A7Y6IXS2_9ACTN|nr:TetR/AcrR family transcriptional regulator [Nonomuraea rhodomycinica]